MKTWIIISGIILLAAIGLFLSFPKSVGNNHETKVIQLIAKTSTWRPGEKPYDIENAVRRSLESTGFKVVSENNENVHAVIHIDYTESRKAPAPLPQGEGTTIDCDIELSHHRLGFIFRDHLTVEAEGGRTYSEAVGELGSKLEKLNLGQKVAFFMAMSSNEERRLEYAYMLSKNKEGVHRADAARVLADIEDPKAAEILISFLKDGDPLVRGQAAIAFGTRKSLMGVLPLISMLNDEKHSDVYHRAIESLGKIGDKRAIEPIRQFAQKDRGIETQQIAERAVQMIEMANP